MSRLKAKLIFCWNSRLSQGCREYIFRMLAKKIDVQSVTVSGSLGLFEGSLDDSVVLGAYRSSGTWSPGLQKFLKEIAFPTSQGTYLDIGANIGLMSIPLAKERKVKCIVFEPAPLNYAFLAKNIISNGVASYVTAYNMALFDRAGQLEMELAQSNMGDNRIRTDVEERKQHQDRFDERSRRTVLVASKRLDDVVSLSGLEHPITAKIDVQGLEVRVLKGATKIVAATRFLIIEYWPYGLLRVGDQPSELLNLLRQFPFACKIDDTSLETPKFEPTDKMLERLTHIPADGSSIVHADLIFSRRPQL